MVYVFEASIQIWQITSNKIVSGIKTQAHYTALTSNTVHVSPSFFPEAQEHSWK